MLKYYAIKHIVTGNYLARGQGNKWVDISKTNSAIPKLTQSFKAAQSRQLMLSDKLFMDSKIVEWKFTEQDVNLGEQEC